MHGEWTEIWFTRIWVHEFQSRFAAEEFTHLWETLHSIQHRQKVLNLYERYLKEFSQEYYLSLLSEP
jgi:hypothetical protein